MDATVVELTDSGSGRGCQAGWPSDTETVGDYATDFCGPVTGAVDGHQVTFDLALAGWGEPLHYIIEGTLSASEDRIGGVHRITEGDLGSPGFTEWEVQPGAAIRDDHVADPGPFPVGEPWPLEAVEVWYGRLTAITETQQGPFVSGQEYAISRAWTTIGGDLGEFLGGELSFETSGAGNVTVHAGPVPRTLDDRPVRLAIRFVAGLFADVEVEMPSGEIFLLSAG